MFRNSILLLVLCMPGTAASTAQIPAPLKINAGQSGFEGILDNLDFFGASLANLGDLDGDGVPELAVGATGDDDRGASSGAVWILSLTPELLPERIVERHTKISPEDTTLTDDRTGDFFGASLANLGDLDGDGVPELAVGANGDDIGGANTGAVWILFLRADGTVKDQQKISATTGGFGGTLKERDLFGSALANLGDLDGDGVPELAVGATGDDDGEVEAGAVWILFLRADGTVKDQQKISNGIHITHDESDPLFDNDKLGSALANLGDLDGDGVPELAVGAIGDDAQRDSEAGRDTGAVWILFLRADGTVKDQQKISATTGGFDGTLDQDDFFGSSLAKVGDLDNDTTTVATLAVGAIGGGDVDTGAVWLLFLTADGTVSVEHEISAETDGLASLRTNGDEFGSALVALGDLDGDGLEDMAVGDGADKETRNPQGAVWVLFQVRPDNFPPFIASPILNAFLTSDKPELETNLNTVFTDPDGERLTYTAETSDTRIAFAVIKADSLLEVQLNDPMVDETVTITATARDRFGEQEFTTFTITVDEEPIIERPVAERPVTNPEEPRPNMPARIETRIRDNKAIANVEISFRRAGDSEFSSARMTQRQPDEFVFPIPDTLVTDRGIEYWIEATDDRGFSTREPADGTAFLPVLVLDPGKERDEPLHNGTTSADFRLISVPLDLDNDSPSEVLEDDLDEYAAAAWRFYELRPEQTFGEFPRTTDMNPGKAFLIIVKDPGKRIDTGEGTSISTEEIFDIRLHPRWNFIGNPFTFPIPVSCMTLRSIDAPPVLRSFDGSWNNPDVSPVTEIKPFEGYAVFADPNAPDILSINPDLSSDGCAAKQTALAVGREDVAWSIRILARSRTARDVDTRAVVALGASETWDPMDWPEPPGLGDYLSVYFTHPEWDTARYSLDARPEPGDGAVWPFEVATTVHDKVHLTFEGLAGVPPAYEVWLIDDVVQARQNLRETPHYTVAGTDTPRPLTLVVGKSAFVETEAGLSAETPTRFELSPNFPNPFNPTTTIRYALPTAAKVSLIVYTVRGEKVATLAEEVRREAGYHAVVWDGRNDAGAAVASGVYFVRMQAGFFMQARKMVLIK